MPAIVKIHVNPLKTIKIESVRTMNSMISSISLD
jgi:hypothetical protein